MSIYPNPLTEIIQAEIRKHGGVIAFARFMELALYHPIHGYYSREQFEIGKLGDFTTAPHISPLFAQCLAYQAHQVLASVAEGNILELGAGTGQLAIDLLLTLSARQQLPQHYYIFEISPHLRVLQKQRIQLACPDLVERVIWLDALPHDFRGIILANEVLDALPVHCFTITAEGIQERGIANEGEGFAWTSVAPTTTALAEIALELSTRYHLPIGYQSEINLAMSAVITELAGSLASGVILFIDYGYGQREYYHPERQHGTLTCFYQHQHHDNPLIQPGEQDITAHVDFTRVIEIGHEHGLTLAGFTTQAAFLFSCGLLELATAEERRLDSVAAFNMRHAIKLLTLPTEMGERVKVMALGKNFDQPLLGFTQQNRMRDL
jgi:SAM-dependent MidA family methyltransferase